MTDHLTCADSIRPLDLLGGYDAYLSYVDGLWPTSKMVRSMFPHAKHFSLTVLGGKAIADGCDREWGDLSPESAAAWIHWRLLSGAWRPIAYASISAMHDVLVELGKLGINRDQVRLLSAHYTLEEHICGPGVCAEGDQVGVAMDGTQWTDKASGHLHALIDASALRLDFFDTKPSPAPATWEDALVTKISTVKKGESGQAVSNWQGVLVAHGYDLGTSGKSRDGVDGTFGDKTDAATRDFQKSHSLTVDGEAGPRTWTAALA